MNPISFKRVMIDARSPVGRSFWGTCVAALLLSTGCSLPSHQANTQYRGAGANTAAQPPGFAARPGQPMQQQQMMHQQQLMQQQAMQQQAMQQQAMQQQAMSPVMPVSHAVPASLAGRRTACGCNACQSGSCGPANGCQSCTPQGYMMVSPQGWNAYGIDAQEFLCDGGDLNANAAVTRDDRIAGLDPEDTVVHYTTEAGDIHVQPSNRACIYAPRFAAIRKVTGAVAGERAIGPGGVDRPLGPVRVDHDLPRLVMSDSTELGHADVTRRIDSMKDRNRGVPVEGILQPEQADEVLAAISALKLYDLGQLRDNEMAVINELALAAVRWTLNESLDVVIEDLKAPVLTRDEGVEAFTVYDFPDAGRLRIVKMADRSDALPGEKVSFVIRVDNVGDSPVNTVVITDNLTTRLEYVADSETVEGSKAEFIATPNDGQSLKLQWRLTEKLKVGESATIKFECRVR